MAHNLVVVFEFTGSREEYDPLRAFLPKFGATVQLQQAAWFVRCAWDVDIAKAEIRKYLQPDDHVYVFDAMTYAGIADADIGKQIDRHFRKGEECHICGYQRLDINTPD